jgi:hypothetical protein
MERRAESGHEPTTGTPLQDAAKVEFGWGSSTRTRRWAQTALAGACARLSTPEDIAETGGTARAGRNALRLQRANQFGHAAVHCLGSGAQQHR